MTICERLSDQADFQGWRNAARRLVMAGIEPAEVAWRVGEDQGGLFDDPVGSQLRGGENGVAPTVPRGFMDLAEEVICHSEAGRFALLYRLLWRLQGEPHLLRLSTDADVHRAEAMARSVRRDMHKMTAFVRFRLVQDADGQDVYIAWFEPDHFIIDRVASFFVGRFAAMRWSILTPRGSLHWDGSELRRTGPASKADAPDDDAMEAYWRTYYANIFNPARLKIDAMKAEMPRKYWHNLPEAALIAPLIADASRRAAEMVAAMPTLPPLRHLRQSVHAAPFEVARESGFESLEEAAAAARDCRRCGLCQHATQTVFGAGPQDAPVMFLGEQPGDREDLAGRPFVGPAGQLFDQLLDQAGLDRRKAYVTNAVKHFKFVLRGKRRIHQSPGAGEVEACRFWLGLEREFVKPKLIVAMGATALRALNGYKGPLGAMRDRELSLEDGTRLLVTVHPSYLLRIPDEDARRRETTRFLADLRKVGGHVPEMRVDQAA